MSMDTSNSVIQVIMTIQLNICSDERNKDFPYFHLLL